MTINCCKGCKDRYVGCHSKCSKYQERLQLYRNEQEYLKKLYGCSRSVKTVELAQRGSIRAWYQI